MGVVAAGVWGTQTASVSQTTTQKCCLNANYDGHTADASCCQLVLQNGAPDYYSAVGSEGSIVHC